MPRTTITPEEAEEIRELRKTYDVESASAAEAMRTGGEPLEGAALRRAREHDRKAGEALRRIQQILGD